MMPMKMMKITKPEATVRTNSDQAHNNNNQPSLTSTGNKFKRSKKKDISA
jgi:hypothetical protein